MPVPVRDERMIADAKRMISEDRESRLLRELDRQMVKTL
jgi:hypothetical protein